MSARLPFNPSLNLTILADLPGLPPGAVGSRADQWLCSWSVGQRMASSPEILAAARHGVAAVAGLAPLPTIEEQPTATWELIGAGAPWAAALDALVVQGNPAAEALADELGLVLGGVVATVVHASPGARAARPDWPASRWDAWSRVRRLSVGGGLVSGLLGKRMLEVAASWLTEQEVPVQIVLARDPASLVLRGAAAGDIADDVPLGLVLDCGGTTLKRAAVVGGQLVGRPAAPAPGAGRTAYELVEQLTRAAAEVAPAGDGPLGVATAVATYVDGAGQPYPGQLGPYAPLWEVDLVGELSRGMSGLLGRPVMVRVRHDGASALIGARLDDPRVDAVIALGTAIGHALDPVSRASP